LRPKADAANLTGNLAYGEDRHRLEFHYEVIRLWQEPVEIYLQAGMAALPLATLCKLPTDKPLPEALSDVVREINGRFRREATDAEAARLMTAAYILTGLRVKKGELAAIYKGIGLMQESTAFDEAIEEGLAQGLAQGLARGLARGIVQGQVQTLLRQGRKRFGPPDAAAEAELTSIKDLDRLERLADAVLTATSWKELLATP
jgi:predicted transposase YdaD